MWVSRKVEAGTHKKTRPKRMRRKGEGHRKGETEKSLGDRFSDTAEPSPASPEAPGESATS